MSDHEGSLLFYTDGEQVWNKKHQLMPNGTGLTIGLNYHGMPSVIIPHPGDPALYYIFSANQWNGISLSGLHYAIVDISRDNGNGDVIQKNVDLLNPSTILLSAVNHPDNKSVWIMGHEWRNNKFYAYRVSETGVSPPVVSAIGGTYYWFDFDPQQMVFSPDGSKLAVATGGIIELFDFNALTGKLSNLKRISLVNDGFQGVAFSPNSLLLYGSGGNDSMYQMDVSSGDGAQIQQSVIQIGSVLRNIMTDLQLAYNGKIYGGRGGGDCCLPLIVINDPNVKGPGCNFVNEGQEIPNDASYGLPLSNQSLHRDLIVLQSEPTCLGSASRISVASLGYADSVVWIFGDGKFAKIIFPVPSTILHSYAASGMYDVSITKYIGTVSREIRHTVEVKPNPKPSLGSDTTICRGQKLILSNEINGQTVWSTGQTSNEIEVTAAGKYWVKSTARECVGADTINVQVSDYPQLSLPDRVIACDDNPVRLKATDNTSLAYKWSTGNITNEIFVTEDGKYTVSAANGRCVSYDSSEVWFRGITDLQMQPQSYSITAPEETVTIKASATRADKFIWSFGDDQKDETVTPTASHHYQTAGIYTGKLRAENAWECFNEVEFNVTIPLFEFIPNVFSPNGDGYNDAFQIIFNGDLSTYYLRVFDRGGQRVFENSDPSILWSAQGQPAAIYFYEVILGRNRRKGWVQVMK